MIPDESTEVVEVPTITVPAADIFVELDPAQWPGMVVLTIASDDADTDIELLIPAGLAAETGDLLFRRACETGAL